MVPEVRVAVGFGSLIADNARLVRENKQLREAVEDMNNVVQAAVEALGLER